jgi:hypothetical protein
MGATTSNFSFLPTEFRTIAESAIRAEGHIMGDPRAACFHARFALESAVHWLYRHDAALRMPYDQSLGALLHEPSFQNLLPQAVFQKARVIQKIGNQAVHSNRPIRQYDALQAVKELHHLCHWLARTYTPDASQRSTPWNDGLVPQAPPAGEVVPRKQLVALEQKLAEQNEAALKAAAGAGRAGCRAAGPARAVGRDPCRRRAAAGPARLLRGRDPPLPDRCGTAPRRLATGSGPRPGIRGHRDAQPPGHRLCRLRALGRRRAAAGAGRGEEDNRRSAGGPAAGQAVRRLPGADVRPAADHLLHQRLHDLDLGRYEVSAATGGGILQEGRAGPPDPSPDTTADAGCGPGEGRHRGTLLPEAGHR